MRTTSFLLPAVLLTACGTMQETTQVRDDVYDIPDRTLVASVDPVPEPTSPAAGDDYYNENEAAQYEQGSYYDRTYNDPSWYNRDRFGFGFNTSPWGNSWGMSYGSGWGNNTWFNSPTGYYNPYMNNSWQSGYGYYSPWNGGMYDPWYNGWGGGYGCGYNWGWNSPYGWGNSWGCNNGYGGYGGYGYPYGGYGGGGGWGSDFSQSVIVRPRPSMSGGGNPAGADVSVVPRMARPKNNITLLHPSVVQGKGRPDRPSDQDRVITRPATRDTGRDQILVPGTITKDRKPADRKDRKDRPVRTRERSRDTAPNFDRGGGGNSGGGNSGGGSRGGGGGTSPSPRPRR